MNAPMTDVELDVLTQTIEDVILLRAATWEVDFDAGPGQVVSVSDAAHVAARLVDNLMQTQSLPGMQ